MFSFYFLEDIDLFHLCVFPYHRTKSKERDDYAKNDHMIKDNEFVTLERIKLHEQFDFYRIWQRETGYTRIE